MSSKNLESRDVGSGPFPRLIFKREWLLYELPLKFSFHLKIKPTTGDTTDLDECIEISETRDKSNDIVINGYIESKFLSTWVELNLFGRYKVRENSLKSLNFRFQYIRKEKTTGIPLYQKDNFITDGLDPELSFNELDSQWEVRVNSAQMKRSRISVFKIRLLIVVKKSHIS